MSEHLIKYVNSTHNLKDLDVVISNSDKEWNEFSLYLLKETGINFNILKPVPIIVAVRDILIDPSKPENLFLIKRFLGSFMFKLCRKDITFILAESELENDIVFVNGLVSHFKVAATKRPVKIEEGNPLAICLASSHDGYKLEEMTDG